MAITEGALKKLAFLSGGLAFLLAAIIISEWHTGRGMLVLISPDTVPMQYNTSLCHALCGFAIMILACMRGRARYLAALMAALVMAFTFAIGLQYLTGHDYGLDGLFVDPMIHSQSKTAYPGRMAPNTVVCFTMVTLGIMLWCFIRDEERKFNTVMVLAALVLALSGTALSGYVLGIEAAYGWWSLSNMAPQTAMEFFLEGAGLMACVLATSPGFLQRNMKAFRVPALVTAGGIALTLFLSQSLLDQGRARMDFVATAETDKIAHIAEIAFENRFKALQRMQARWDAANGISQNQWRQDAQNYVMDYASYLSIALMDNDLRIYDSVSKGDAQDFWVEARFDRMALDQARQSGKVHIARSTTTAEPVLMIFLPLTRHGEADGFLATAYSFNHEMKEAIGLDTDAVPHFQIFDEKGVLASNFEDGQAYTWQASKEMSINARGIPLKVRVDLNAANFDSGSLVFMIFIGGICVSILLANALFKADKIRQIMRELEERKDRYDLTVNGARIALWDWDVGGGTVIWGGHSGKMFGMDEAPTKESEIRACYPPEDNEALNRDIERSLADSDTFTTEFRIRHPDGKHIWVSAVGKVVERKEGQPSRIVGIMMDITQRRLTEEALRRSNEELERFAYIASHDLKAPLRGIDNLAKWVSEDLDPVMTEDARAKMSLLRGRVSRLEMLLEDILQYSRAGRITDEPVRVDTGEMVARILQERPMPEGFSLKAPENMPVIISPSTPLEQVFFNLIANAWKHHDRKEGVVQIGVQDRGAFYEFSVTDDGPGIPPEFHARVFKMFQTLKPRDDKESSGLGLSIVKKLVEWQGGRIWIVSQPGMRGTSFHFLWPKTVNAYERKKDAA